MDLPWQRANALNVSFQFYYSGQFTLSTETFKRVPSNNKDRFQIYIIACVLLVNCAWGLQFFLNLENREVTLGKQSLKVTCLKASWKYSSFCSALTQLVPLLPILAF